MSKTTETKSNGQVEHWQGVLQPWLDLCNKTLEQSQEHLQLLMACTPPNVDAAAARKQWLDALARSLDSYLRTPAFLEAMRANFESLTTLKSSGAFVQREVARQAGIPHTEDIAGLFMRMQSAHDAITARLDEISRRLAAVERGLGRGS